MRVNLRINYTAKNIDGTKEIIDILSGFPKECSKYISVDYQRVWQDKESDNDFTYDKVRIFRDRLRGMGFYTPNNHILDFVKDPCYADNENEYLFNYNGDVFKCTARDFTSSSRIGKLNPDGKIDWNDGLLNKRRKCKFSKPICHDCRIAPICGGGCRTKCIENASHENCNLGYSSKDIDELILKKFEHRFMSNE